MPQHAGFCDLYMLYHVRTIARRGDTCYCMAVYLAMTMRVIA